MDVAIREASTLDDAQTLAALFAEVWGTHDAGPARVDLLRAMSHSGAYVSLAEDGGRPIGGTLAWVGIHDGHPILHSHLTGVLPGLQSRSVGLQLKRHQRAWCLDRSIAEVHWTFDPLIRRNAWFNLARLGAGIAAYETNFYGEMPDATNGGDESDRAVAVWKLESATAIAALDGPVVSPAGDGTRTIEVPADIVGLRASDPAEARRWRLQLRDELGGALADGWKVDGFTADASYVLVPADAQGSDR